MEANEGTVSSRLAGVQRILGIDPGLNTTGYGVIDVQGNRLTLIEAGVIRSTAKHALEERLIELHDGLAEVIESLKPDVMSIEKLYSHYDRPTTAILMGHARGVLILAAGKQKVPVVDYSATQIKKILTGSGHATKMQMQLAIMHQLSLAKPPEPPDVADALAGALTHYYLSRPAVRQMS